MTTPEEPVTRPLHDDPPAYADQPRPGGDQGFRDTWTAARRLADQGVVLCLRPGATGLTDEDLVTVQWFLDWCKDPGKVPFPGCPRCVRVTSIDLEPGYVASCGEHAYVRKGAPR